MNTVVTAMKEKFSEAGRLIRSKTEGWTDEELRLINDVNEMVATYLAARGPEWNLALWRIRMDQNTFEGYVWARQTSRCHLE